MASTLNEILQLCNSRTEEEASIELTALITSTTHDDTPPYSLAEILDAILTSESAGLLDPLTSIPILLQSNDVSANEILVQMSSKSSAKEIVIGIQEALEHIQALLESEDDEAGIDQRTRSPSSQFVTLIQLYGTVIPRLVLRNKTATGTIHPLISQIVSTAEFASKTASQDEGRRAINATCRLVERAYLWAKTQKDAKDEELNACRAILKGLIESIVSAYSHCINASLSPRAFQRCFPRLARLSKLKEGWEDGADTMRIVLATYTELGAEISKLPPAPTTGYLMHLAHSDASLKNPDDLLTVLFPVIIASIQSNTVLDETLSILLTALYEAHQITGKELSADLIIPLSTILPSLASGHPDPFIRHHTFRTLSLLLSLSPPLLRMQVLKELTTDDKQPQMRVAAVGLVKEAVIDALSSKPSLFASPHFVQVFGPILLQPDPPDLFLQNISFKDVAESSEPARLTECLALYYVLLIRDEKNQTGIRDIDTIANVEKSFLGPLRSTLTRWLDETDAAQSHIHTMMPLVSLKTGIERVDDVLTSLRAK